MQCCRVFLPDTGVSPCYGRRYTHMTNKLVDPIRTEHLRLFPGQAVPAVYVHALVLLNVRSSATMHGCFFFFFFGTS